MVESMESLMRRHLPPNYMGNASASDVSRGSADPHAEWNEQKARERAEFREGVEEMHAAALERDRRAAKAVELAWERDRGGHYVEGTAEEIRNHTASTLRRTK